MATTGSDSAPGRLYPADPRGYRYQWWSLPGGAFAAEGLFGQFLYIDPSGALIAVVLSAWLSTWDAAAEQQTYALIASAGEALR